MAFTHSIEDYVVLYPIMPSHNNKVLTLVNGGMASQKLVVFTI